MPHVMNALESSPLEEAIAEDEDEKYIKTGDLIVFGSEEEGEPGLMASGTGFHEDDVVVTVGDRDQRCVFEVFPMTRYTARKALKRVRRDKTSAIPSARDTLPTTVDASSLPASSGEVTVGVLNAEVEESSRAETVQNEAIHSQLEGKVVKYGQVIQLQHLHNGKWLAARTKDCADLETDCAKVFLHKEGGSKCWFKLLPRTSGKSEGDKVAVGDQVVLQHKKSGNMIHRSNMTNEAGDYEVNLATSLTVFTLAHSAAGGRRNLRAGQLIRLAHQESGYLSVLDQVLRLPASLAPSDRLPDVVRQAGLPSAAAPSSSSSSAAAAAHSKDIVVKRPKRRRTHHRVPTSYDSVWLLESEYSGSSGTITWGTRCRFQLFGAQGHYLCLSEQTDAEQQGNARGELRLMLTNDKHHVDTLFVFLPFGNKKGEDIAMGSYVRVQHARTRTYLHASTSASMQLIGADDRVRVAVCSQQLYFNDVFGVHAVAQSQVEIIGFVNKRRLGRIEEYVSRLRLRQPLSDSELNSTHSVLVDLIRFCTFPPPPDDDPLEMGGGIHIKPHQKVLGSPAVLALLLDAATVPFANLATRRDVQAMLQRDMPVLFLTKLLWNLLARIALRNTANGTRLMRFLPRMLPFLGMEVGVERCLMEIFRENTALLNALSPAHIQQIMHMLFAHGAALPNLEGLVLLQVLCSCEQGALSNNQNAIVTCLLDDFPYVLVRSRLRHGQLQLCNADSVGRRLAAHRARSGAADSATGKVKKRWENLVDFTYDTELREHLVYYVHVLTLLAHLCLGRNYCAIAAVAALVRFEEAFTGLASDDLPYNVRAAYSQILLHCFVDCFPQRAADIQLVWSVSTVTRDDQRDISVVPAPHAATELQLARLKDLLRNMLVNDRIPAFPCYRVYMHLVALVRALMHFRFYSLAELESDVLPRLTEVLLEGGTAAEQKKGGEQRQALMRTAVGHSPYRNDETTLLVDILLEVCHTFKVYFRLRLKHRFQLVMHQLQEESVGSPEDAEVRQHLREVIGLHMEESGTQSPQHHNFDENVFSSALVQLLKHQNNRLSSEAVDLLLSVQTRQVRELYELVPRVQLLLDDEAVHTAASVECELLPMLQQFASQPHTADRQAQVKDTLGKLVRLCLVPNTREPHALNQRLLRHLKVHEAIFRILEMPLDPASQAGSLADSTPSSSASSDSTPRQPLSSGGTLGRATTAQLPSIFRGCYAFLRLFCYQNRANQHELYPRLVFFLGQLPLCLGVELTLTELFRNNRQLCQRVSPAVLDPLVSLLLAHGPDPNVLRFFQAVVVAEGSPIRSNQTAVVRRLVQHPQLMRVDADDPGKLRTLVARWRGDETKEPAGELGYHLQLVHLLARCSLGKSHECESVCQNLISVDRCLEVLNDPSMNAWVKAAYATFLDEVWLNTAVADAVVLLQNMGAFWQYLSECRNLLVAFCEALTPEQQRRNAAELDLSAQQQPRAPRAGEVSLQGDVVDGAAAAAAAGVAPLQRRLTGALPPPQAPTVVRVTADNLRSVTEYIFHAVLPLLQHFYGTHFVFEKAPPLHTTIANDTVDALCQVFSTSITAKDKLLQAATCLEVLLSQGITGNEVFLMTDAILDKVRAETRKQARRQPRHTLSPALQSEIELSLSAVPPRFWRLDDVYANIVRLMQENRSRPGDFEEIAVAIIRNPDYCKLSLQLAALRVLRYFVRSLPARQRTDMQNLLHDLDAVPAAVALLGSEDDEVVTEALELLVALLENNRAVCRALMESYLNDMRDESFFPDVRTLIQKALTTLNRRKQWRVRRDDLLGNAAAVDGEIVVATEHSQAAFDDLYHGDDDVGAGTNRAVAFGPLDMLDGSSSKRRMVQRQKTRVHNLTRLLSSGSLAAGGVGGAGVGDGVGSLGFAVGPSGGLREALGPQPKDSPFILMTFRVMELLCEGHLPRVQRYMREQPDNFRSYDLIKQCVQYFQAFESEVGADNIELAIQLATTLKEFVPGCPENQRYMVSYKVLRPLNSLLGRDLEAEGVDPDRALHLKAVLVKLLYSLVEGNTESQVATEVIESLDFEPLQELARWLKPGPGEPLPSEQQKALGEAAFKTIRMLGEANTSRNSPQKQADLADTLARCNDLYKDVLGRVEIVKEDRKIEYVYFAVKESCTTRTIKELEDAMRSRLTVNSINLQSSTAKIDFFCHWAEDLLIEFEHLVAIRRRLLYRYRSVWNWGAFLLAIVINLLVIILGDGGRNSFKYNTFWLVESLAIVHAFLSFLVMISFFHNTGRITHHRSWKKRLRNANDSQCSILATFDERRDAVMRTLRQPDEHGEPRRRALPWYLFYSTMHFVLDLRSLWYVAYFVLSVLGAAVSPYFFCFHLLDMLYRSQGLRDVLKALTLSWKVLLLLGAFTVVIIWGMAIYAMLFIPDKYQQSYGLYCNNPLQCMVSSLSCGISNQGQMFEFVGPAIWEDGGETALLVIFNVFSFVLVGIILFNIIFAVIVDKFGQLRDKRTEITLDRANRCFVCSIEREVFQQQYSEKGKRTGVGNQGYLNHVNYDHRPWDYLFLFVYLKEKHSERQELTTNERYVFDRINHSQWLRFFPIGVAKVLEGQEKSDAQRFTQVDDKVSQLEKVILNLNKLVLRMSSKLDASLTHIGDLESSLASTRSSPPAPPHPQQQHPRSPSPSSDSRDRPAAAASSPHRPRSPPVSSSSSPSSSQWPLASGSSTALAPETDPPSVSPPASAEFDVDLTDMRSVADLYGGGGSIAAARSASSSGSDLTFSSSSSASSSASDSPAASPRAADSQRSATAAPISTSTIHPPADERSSSKEYLLDSTDSDTDTEGQVSAAVDLLAMPAGDSTAELLGHYNDANAVELLDHTSTQVDQDAEESSASSLNFSGSSDEDDDDGSTTRRSLSQLQEHTHALDTHEHQQSMAASLRPPPARPSDAQPTSKPGTSPPSHEDSSISFGGSSADESSDVLHFSGSDSE